MSLSTSLKSGVSAAETQREGLKERALSADFALLAALSVAAVVWRLAALFSSGKDPAALNFPDEQVYYFPGALHFLQQGWTYFLTERSLWNGPVNILWIALWDAQAATVKVANCVLLALSGLLIWDCAYRLSGRTLAYATLILFTLYSPFQTFATTILTEPLFIPLLVASLWLTCVAEGREHRGWWYFGAGALFGIATLVRPTTQLYPFFLFPLYGLALCVPGIRSGIANVRAALLVSFFAGFLLFTGPWAAKNYFFLGKIGIANGAGAVLYLGNDLRKDGDEPVYSGMDFDTFDISQPFTHLDTEGDRRLTRAGFDWIFRFPLESSGLFVRKLGRYLFGYDRAYFYPYRDGISYIAAHSLSVSAGKVLEILSVVLLAAFSAVYVVKLGCSSPFRFMLTSLMLYFTALHVVTFPIPRLALPLFPYYLIAAGMGVQLVRSGLRSSQFGGAIAVSAISFSAFGYIFLGGVFHKPGVVAERFYRYFEPQEILTDQEFSATHAVEIIDALTVVTKGFDPYIEWAIEPRATQKNQVLLVTLRATPSRSLKREKRRGNLYWATQDGYRADQTVEFDVYLDGEEHTYLISPSLAKRWSGMLTRLRLDFPDRLVGVTYRLTRVEFSK